MRAWRSTSLLRSEGQQFVRAFCTCNKFSLSKPQMPMGDGIFWCWVGGFFVVYLLTPWAPADSRGMNKEDVNTGKKACGGPPWIYNDLLPTRRFAGFCRLRVLLLTVATCPGPFGLLPGTTRTTIWEEHEVFLFRVTLKNPCIATNVMKTLVVFVLWRIGVYVGPCCVDEIDPLQQQTWAASVKPDELMRLMTGPANS